MDGGLRQMRRRLADYRNSLFEEGILGSQYLVLHDLQDESHPDFAMETVALFITNSEKLLNDLYSDLAQQNVDFKRVDGHLYQLNGSSSTVGVPRITTACMVFRDFCQARNVAECLRCLRQLREELVLVNSKLETLFKLENQILLASGSIPRMEPSD